MSEFIRTKHFVLVSELIRTLIFNIKNFNLFFRELIMILILTIDFFRELISIPILTHLSFITLSILCFL